MKTCNVPTPTGHRAPDPENLSFKEPISKQWKCFEKFQDPSKSPIQNISPPALSQHLKSHFLHSLYFSLPHT